MQEHERLSPALQALEAKLASLVPTAAALDRDRLMYEAGRASLSSRRGWAWPLALAASIALALVAGRWTAPHSVMIPEQNIAQTPPRESTTSVAMAAAAEPDSYLQLRRQIMQDEVVAVSPPRGPSAPVPKASQAEMLRELLN